MAITTEDMERIGTKAGRTYWYNPRDLYVYQQLPDGTMNGWIAHISAWEKSWIPIWFPGWSPKG